MGFLAQYGLFALKALTLVLSFLFLLVGILVLTKKPKPRLRIESLNGLYDTVKKQMCLEVKGKKNKKSDKNKRENDPALFVVDFNGDIKASQVDQLREEISAILSIATEKDEVLIRLESPGGAVNGYGLAASQLQRIRDRNINLTVCIDKVAASGGYLISCVANTIIAAPFAIIGSIGVVAQIPNLHRWLKKHDIDVELVTAGKYKRTLTLLGENTDEARKKFKEDLDLIHQTFRKYVVSQRHEIDIDKVSTGEHWLATDALELKLVDRLLTSDDYLMQRMTQCNAYKISWHVKESLGAKLLKPVMHAVHTLT